MKGDEYMDKKVISKRKIDLADFNRKNILAAANKLFFEKGIRQTTMDDIAKKADYSKSTIYVYFKSKEEIYNYIILDSMTQLKNKIEESIQSSKDFESSYYAICNTLTDFQQENSLYFESILKEISTSQDEFEKYPVLREICQVGDSINQNIIKMLQSAIESKYLRPDIEPLVTTLTLWASICGLITLADKKELYIRQETNASKEEFLRKGFELLLESIINKK